MRTVRLATECPPPAPADRPDSYKINQNLKVSAVPGEELSGEVAHGGEEGFLAQVAGIAVTNTGCGTLVGLSFGTATALPSRQHTTIIVDLPKTFTVTDDRPVPYLPGSAPPTPKKVELAILRPDKRTLTVTLRVEDVEVSGSPD